MGYSLKINYKKIESNPNKSTPESRKKRDLQFKYINIPCSMQVGKAIAKFEFVPLDIDFSVGAGQRAKRV